MDLLDVDHISKSFGAGTVLKSVELHVQSGDVHMIVGPPKSGKSVLLDCLTGWIRPDSGSILFNRRQLIGLVPHEVAQLGVARMFSKASVFDELTVLENVTIPALAVRDGIYQSNLLQGIREYAPERVRAAEVLQRFGLSGELNRYAAKLNYGERRRLELAICLAREPALLVLDEPTAGMSAAEAQEMVEQLLEICADGTAVVVATRDHGLASRFARRVTCLSDGAVPAHGMSHHSSIRLARRAICAQS